ncbi:TetR/AcrR family transcriptional regulator [Terricaulis sp.]|uniref:TetR/AcrR family transcriptional regulator n=1 Tax=Terricaulis sp. TaxID=2768686 RepID=UPI003782F2BB
MANAKTKAETQPPRDGRRARTEASRKRIVEAMLALAREGQPDPSADLVAERAGVGRRTVFRLFQDMDSLYRELHAAMEQRIEHIRAIPVDGATWRERLEKLIERRVKLFEEILPIKMAGDVHRHRSQFLQESHNEVQKTLRVMLRFVLPKTIDGDQFEAIDAALSIDVWERLRTDQKLSTKAAQRVLTQMATALVEDVKA